MSSSYVDHSARGDGGQQRSHERRNFVPNEELGEPPSLRLVRAPADADTLDCDDFESECFACAFTNKKKPEDPFNASEVQDAYEDMMRLISENYSRGVSNPELVKLVYAFYEREIRQLGDFPEWTLSSISRHMLYHTNNEDVLMQEATNMLYSQIQSLRSKTWVKNDSDGTCEPVHKNICLLDKLIRGLDDHLVKKKARKVDK
jgi:hypothetical protein